ncbi:MAG TPA: metallophosphoesterase [Bryobacteraceae bacterium]
MYRSLAFLVLSSAALAQNAETWKFAVSGDSRNCGDIVMPAIAAGVMQDNAKFYWHLGDYRAIYTIDEDLVPPRKLNLPSRTLSTSEYHAAAWPDFISHQLAAFGSLPVFLAIGNHETISPMNRTHYLAEFARWLNARPLRKQRQADNPRDHEPRTWYHWVDHNIDFITLDNASTDEFDAEQVAWFKSLISRDEASPQIRAIVVGMHAALPGSFGFNHSMNDWIQGELSGNQVYLALWHAQESAHKHVYVLASHSHFFMEDVYRTTYWKEKVLPGWIVGTAGAVRYRLPAGAAASGRKAMTNVYGYLLGTAASDGSISFAFHQLTVDDLLRANQGKAPAPLVHWCFDENHQ